MFTKADKISRRIFLKTAGSGLAGTALNAPPRSAATTPPVPQHGAVPCASELRIAPPPGAGTKIFLSPQALSMPEPRIAFKGRDLRLFNARGSVSFRRRTVTGLKAMIFPPLNLSDPQITPPLGLSEGGFFNLSFREQETDTLIQDIQDEFADPLYLNQKNRSANTLGPVYQADEASSILLSQDAQWWPHCYVRTGIFHRRMSGRLISFAVECRVYLSTVADEVYQEIDLQNRTDQPLALTIIPDQPRKDERVPRFVRQEGEFAVEVVCDLGPASGEGWHLEIAPRSASTARLALLLKAKDAPPSVGFHDPDLSSKVRASVAANVEQLSWASAQLPQVNTSNAVFDEFYKRSILSVLCCRRVRENFCVQPFYDLGFGRGAAVAWDTSFASKLIAQLDPDGLLGMIKAFLRSGGALNSTYLEWTGKSRGWYAQTPFSLMQLVSDYLRHTGDTGAIEAKLEGTSILEYLKQAGKEFLTHYAGPSGLIDIGEGTGKMLEIRTRGYEHVVATINALAVDYFLQLSEWCALRHESDAELFRTAAGNTQAALNSRLWDEGSGWYGNLYPDGTRQLVYSYHVYDVLGTSAIPQERKRRLAERIREGEFLAPYGMYSISLSDRDHWDMEDCDWGGGGQYTGQPLRIAQNLYACGEEERAWQILSRCTRWVERFPYFPQTIYGDELSLQEHQVDWPLQISSGAGAQAIISGVFGLNPQFDGTLTIEPHYNASLGKAQLTSYRFRGHAFSVTLDAKGFVLFKDGQSLGQRPYHKAMKIST